MLHFSNSYFLLLITIFVIVFHDSRNSLRKYVVDKDAQAIFNVKECLQLFCGEMFVFTSYTVSSLM